MRPRGEVELNYGWLVVDTGNKSYLRVEVFLCDAMSGIDVEPVIRVSQPATQGSVVAVQARGPGLGVVSSQIQIAENNELGIDSAGTIVRIERVTGLLIGCDESDVGALALAGALRARWRNFRMGSVLQRGFSHP